MKTNKTNTWVIPIAVLVLSLACATSAFAVENTEQVQASVEMEQYCVNLDLGSELDFGSVGLGEVAPEVNDHPITVRNSGSGDATIMIRGTDATGPDSAVWNLADAPAPGTFAWYFVDSSPDSDGSKVFVAEEARILVKELGYMETVALNATMMTPTCTRMPGLFTFGATIYAVPFEE